jgi:hypothetical protein
MYWAYAQYIVGLKLSVIAHAAAHLRELARTRQRRMMRV